MLKHEVLKFHPRNLLQKIYTETNKSTQLWFNKLFRVGVVGRGGTCKIDIMHTKAPYLRKFCSGLKKQGVGLDRQSVVRINNLLRGMWSIHTSWLKFSELPPIVPSTGKGIADRYVVIDNTSSLLPIYFCYTINAHILLIFARGIDNRKKKTKILLFKLFEKTLAW